MLCLGPLTYTLIERWGWRIMLRVVGSILLVVGVAAIFAFHPPPPPPTTSGPDEDDTKESKLGDQDVSPPDGTREGSEIPDDHTNARVQPKYARLFNEMKTDQNQNAEDGSAGKHADCEKTSEEMKPFLQEQIAESVIGKEVCTSPDRCNSDIAVALTASESTLPDGAVLETGEEAVEPATFWTKHRSIFYPDVWVLGLCIMGLGVMNSFFYINMVRSIWSPHVRLTYLKSTSNLRNSWPLGIKLFPRSIVSSGVFHQSFKYYDRSTFFFFETTWDLFDETTYDDQN